MRIRRSAVNRSLSGPSEIPGEGKGPAKSASRLARSAKAGRIASGEFGHLMLPMGLAFLMGGCAILKQSEPTSLPDFGYRNLDSELIPIQTLPESPSRVVRRGRALLMVSKGRRDVYRLELESSSAPTRIGGDATASVEFVNVTDVGFVEGTDSVFVLDQSRQRLSFFSGEGKFQSSVAFGLLGIMGVKAMAAGGSTFVLTPPVAPLRQVVRIERDRIVGSFLQYPQFAADLNLRPFSVPIAAWNGQRLFAAHAFSPAVQAFSKDGVLLEQLSKSPDFYRPPSYRDDSMDPDSDSFRRWYASWTSLYALLPYKEGVARVFMTHSPSKFTIDFMLPDGETLEPIETEGVPFSLVEGEIFVYMDRTILRGHL